MNLAIAKGEVMFIIGTSGVGKSVTIKHLIGLLRIDAGEIWFDGARVDQLPERELAPLRRRIGMVFQSSTLFDSMTLAENVALPLRKHQQHGAAAPRSTRRAAARAGLHGRATPIAIPAELSDGMRKRAAIARTLALDPEVVLFDEPTTGLDPVSARRIDRLIRELADKLGVTAVVVSHDPPSIFGIADRVAFLYQGVVHVVATPGRAPRVDRSDRPAVHHRPVVGPDGDARVLTRQAITARRRAATLCIARPIFGQYSYAALP